MQINQINQYIDHTLLKPEATKEQIAKLCQEAIQYQFKAVCVNPTHVSFCHNILKDCEVKVCTVIGFPLGASRSEVKAFEAQTAINEGADEIDMVLNIGALIEGNLELVENDIKAVAVVCKNHQILLKVIFETCLLNNEQIIKACEASLKAGADFVKTSTGFSTGGATLEHVSLMKKTVGDKLQVKASGGVRDLETAMAMIAAGATRLGTSSGISLIKGQSSESNY
jgi:deoxyribose-phosphate aldolase